jgi:rSAM/selenodomain-associated transferase 1
LAALPEQGPVVEELQHNMITKTKNAVIVFQKNLVAGRVKTRLAKTLGNDEALEIYKSLIKTTYLEIGQLKDVDIFIYLSDYVEELPFDIKGKSYQILAQEGKDLGERMKNAFRDCFGKGYQKCIIIGTDCPEISTKDMQLAFDKLSYKDIIIGPAADGGYYLLGLKKETPALFESINWSTAEVLSSTTHRAEGQNLSFEKLRTLNDIDTEKDWKLYNLKIKNEQLP